MNELAGSFWPSDRQKLLLRAALLEGEPSASAWRDVRPSFDLDDPDPASQALLPLVYRQLERLGIEDPGLPKLRGIYRRTWYMNQLLLDRLKGALETVEAAGGDPLVVSSWELPLRYYGDLGLRPVAALHLLVRPDGVARAARALSDEGWMGPLEPSKAFLRSRHHARYERANGDLCFVYWRLFHEFSDPERGLEAEDLWERPLELELRGVSARALSPTDELLNVCVSGARMSSWPSVTWVADAMAVLRAPNSAIDWERLVRQARRLRATLRLHDAASFLRQELDAPVPADVLDKLRGAPMSRREVLAHRAAGTRLGPLGATPDTLTRFLRLTADASVPRALSGLPTFLRDEWGLERRSQVPFAALRKSVAKIAGSGPRPRQGGPAAITRPGTAAPARAHERDGVSRMLDGRVPNWRGVAARLDLLRSTRPRHAWRRLQQDRALRTLAQSRRDLIARELWADAARELDAAVTELEPGRFEIRRGSAMTTVAGQTVALNSPAALALAADKPAVYRLVADAGLPVPEHLSFAAGDLHAARAFLAREPGPCVVKPARGRGGDGVTGEVRSAGDLRRAALTASRFAPQLLIERQVAGDVFRLLVLDGEVLDVVRRRRPVITGDGRSTVEELILAEYDRRIRAEGNPGLKPFAVDLDCVLSLRQAGVPLRSVPPAGSTLPIKTVTNYNSPKDNETLRSPIAPALAAEVTGAVEALGLRLAGVDVVTPTPAAALATSGGAIVDVNEAPALHHHAHVADADSATRVAAPILRALLERPNHVQ